MSRSIDCRGYWFLDDSLVITKEALTGEVPFSLEEAKCRLLEIIALDTEIRAQPQWQRECSSYETPDLACFRSFEDYKAAATEWLQRAKKIEAGRERKKALIKQRRSQFSVARASIELALIERDGYQCRERGCSCTESLTVDHVVPLSKGGSDDLSNLQLLCQFHNSQKGDRM